jgi:curved DNA-binding protein CbpA
VVPRYSNYSQAHDSHSRDQQHDLPKPAPTKRDELYYASILELPGKFTSSEIKKAYKQQLFRYHPDRVQHLGREFQEIAHRKTQEITEAYDYFCRAYDL